MLSAKYGFPTGLVARLADLFDHNVSQLLVAGKHSKELPNLRGLLQGSSLSPVLFNFLINELALELEQQFGTGVLVHGRHVNSLLFADDTALVAATDWQMAQLLNVCERWAQKVRDAVLPNQMPTLCTISALKRSASAY